MTPKSSIHPEAARDGATLGLALLSFAAGSMDAIAFLALGGVFTSAMSGNTIVLGLAIGQGQIGTALRAVTAILGYLAGVAIAAFTLKESGRGSGWTLSLEALFLAAFACLWLSSGGPVGTSIVYSLILLSAVAMGLQGGIGRAIGAPGIMTVIFTSTYTSIVSTIVERATAGQRPYMTATTARQLAALAAYLGGAVIAAIAATHWRSFAPLMPVTVILILLSGLRSRLINFGQKRS